jgi:hypothetical protein
MTMGCMFSDGPKEREVDGTGAVALYDFTVAARRA